MRRTLPFGCLLLAGCNHHQSALAPFGREANETLTLTLVLVAGTVIVALVTAAFYIRAVRAREGSLDHRGGMRLVLWMGAIVPTVLLTVLLLFALPAMRPMETGPEDLVIRVEGEQFWWRVAYQPPGEEPLLSANEIRVPTGRRVHLVLAAGDVIHSFWIPGLAGKMDMIPGRDNDLVVEAEKPGRYRGVCAEFCGLSHALMAFEVVAMEPTAFDAWLAEQRGPSPGATQGRGAALFTQNGCGACHAVRGTAHDAAIGPDLSRFGARTSLGAGILEPTRANTAAFIRDPQGAKPGARMPAYKTMSEADAKAIAAYLKGLQ